MSGEDGKKQYDKLLASWRRLTKDPPPSVDSKVGANFNKLKTDFASGGF